MSKGISDFLHSLIRVSLSNSGEGTVPGPAVVDAGVRTVRVSFVLFLVDALLGVRGEWVN